MSAATPVDLPAQGSEFRRARLIRFSDCDPAGIVFYPQYFVMLNGLVEDWVNEGLGLSYHGLVAVRRIGLPTVKLEADFRAVSRMGDQVTLGLTVQRLGSRSMTLLVRCFEPATGELRMQMQQVLVTTSLETHRAVAIPDDMRAAILRNAPELG
ncbi:acyl-CoA thioesterase [Variovorax sp. Varisp85]|jgi:4-hydroxybenzoyl-CoA thioesterase|uniref:acyl-CoA thioesterase n=1 Tax=unclassified Variovorax TaxID=663243 RepID=UPI000270FAB8|nr:thioesterase family protein [Variovorax sp. CF313]EJL77136.1 putative thioesterase [Variovorax sp. CF313]